MSDKIEVPHKLGDKGVKAKEASQPAGKVPSAAREGSKGEETQKHKN